MTTSRHLRGSARAGLLCAWIATTALSVGPVGALHGQGSNRADQPAPAVVQLARCRRGVGMACMIVSGTPAGAARSDSTRLRALLDTSRLLGPGEARSERRERIQLLVLFDVSGSMLKDDAVAVTRVPLRTFLRGLPASVAAAVAPFESRGVQQVIAATRFVPAPQIDAQLDRLPTPRRSGNTALYSAISLGLARLDDVVRDSGGIGTLVVITDGSNDVGHIADGDDPGLLDSRPGNRTLVRDRIAASAHRVWLLGAGSGVRRDELQSLAGERATATVVPMDPAALADNFRRIGAELWPERRYVYGVPQRVRDGLGRGVRTIAVDGWGASPITWRPPIVALPPFAESVWDADTQDSLALSSETRLLMLGISPDGTSKLLVAGPLCVMLVLLLVGLPRVLEPSVRGAAPPAGGGKPAPAAAATANGMLRSAVEVPPRKPTDITRDGAT